MPVMSGFEVASLLRERPQGKAVTLVALTGWGQEEDRRRTREAGFDHHLLKPVDLNSLTALLRELPTHEPAAVPADGVLT
jgi:CheY-like chemotaxis protein